VTPDPTNVQFITFTSCDGDAPTANDRLAPLPVERLIVTNSELLIAREHEEDCATHAASPSLMLAQLHKVMAKVPAEREKNGAEKAKVVSEAVISHPVSESVPAPVKLISDLLAALLTLCENVKSEIVSDPVVSEMSTVPDRLLVDTTGFVAELSAFISIVLSANAASPVSVPTPAVRITKTRLNVHVVLSAGTLSV
jgi:hypothetical protein